MERFPVIARATHDDAIGGIVTSTQSTINDMAAVVFFAKGKDPLADMTNPLVALPDNLARRAPMSSRGEV